MKDYKLDIKIDISILTKLYQSGINENDVEEKVRNTLEQIIKNQLLNDYLISCLIEEKNDLKIKFEFITDEITDKNGN